jgi:hypothetical protein
MAVTPTRLAQWQPGVTEATVYTVPGTALRVIVTNIIVANVTTTGVALSLSIVPAGGTAGGANRLIPGTTIPANTVVPFDLSTVMNPGDFISAIAGAASSLTVTISGVVQT